MKLQEYNPPRMFNVKSTTLCHCADIELDSNEVVTFVSLSGAEFDVTRKTWGYYATPSLNKRLLKHNLRAALCVNERSEIFILLVERFFEGEFESYLKEQKMSFVVWLDSAEVVAKLTCNTDSRI